MPTLALWVAGTMAMGLAVARIFTPAFGQNDDVALQSVFSGEMSGSPSSLAPFVSAAFAEVLAAAYRFAPGVPWYGFTVAITGLAACGALGAGVVLANRSARLLEPAATLLALTPIVAWVALRPTFTVSAMLAGAASVLLVAVLVGRSGAVARDVPFLAAALLFAIGGLSMRPTAGGLGVAVAFPALLITAYSLRKEGAARRAALRACVFAVIVGAALLGATTAASVNREASPGWREYVAFNDARGALNETPSGDALASRLEEAGWSDDEFLLFATFALLDPGAPSSEQFDAALRVTADARHISRVLSPGAWGRLGSALVDLARGAGWWLIVLVGITGAFLLRRRISRAGPVAAFCVGWSAVLLVLVGLWQRAPERILVPLTAATFAAATQCVVRVPVISQAGGRQLRYRFIPRLLACLGLVATVLASVQASIGVLPTSRTNDEALLWHARQRAALDYQAGDAGRGILVTPTALAMFVNPYSQERVFPSKSVPLGWIAFSPEWNRRVRSLGLRPRALLVDLGKGRAFLASGAGMGQERAVARLAAEKVGTDLVPCGHGIVWGLCRRQGPPRA